MLTVHHLNTSQSERILWLCEELGVPYQVKHHERDAVTRLSPPELQALHPMGTAPVIEDGDVMLAESGAIVDYIIGRHGQGRLALGPSHPDFAQYLYWFHFANASFQPLIGRNMVLSRTNLPPETPVIASTRDRLARALKFMDARLKDVPFLAGSEFTAADIMIVFSLSTMRNFYPFDLTPYSHVMAYLQRMGEREAYRRAMAIGDPDMKPLLE